MKILMLTLGIAFIALSVFSWVKGGDPSGWELAAYWFLIVALFFCFILEPKPVSKKEDEG